MRFNVDSFITIARRANGTVIGFYDVNDRFFTLWKDEDENDYNYTGAARLRKIVMRGKRNGREFEEEIPF